MEGVRDGATKAGGASDSSLRKGWGVSWGPWEALESSEQARGSSGPCGGWTGGPEEAEPRVQGKWFCSEWGISDHCLV